ncbi:energy-coupling factor transporter transmembrane protein EcfT [Citricoccus sp. SGAir0253]|uniref:energy-coupling factor transporter transmembrane component T family protein n=1 Tax=Citricoccus sp. SGAir0253 TaxID=2567881 RepID=UPI0010CD072F|nr:energy-coupling factor transporter transmembrane component T [Citricoccus sp. SGAir0253]QCU77292.1 energy-coupling factor transporter transmembrane protein EcfT [Citricoccus sp. SGAir0253]
MTAAAPSRPVAVSVFERANPLAKLLALLPVTVVLVASMDWVSSGIVLLAAVALLPLSGIRTGEFLRRAWLLVAAALASAWGTALVGEDSGRVLLAAGPLDVTEGSVLAGAATGLRILAVALPGVMVFITTDPTDLADALAQRLRLPARFVLGSLAAFRMLAVLTDEWRTLGQARRARGVGTGGNPVRRTASWLGQAFGLLVQAIRRATRLAVTMEARGFGAGERTWARESRFTPLDGAVVAAGFALAALAAGLALGTGAWNLVWS